MLLFSYMWEKIKNLFYLPPAVNPEEIKRKYGIPDELSLKIKMTADGWFIVTADDLPGLVTQARSHKELIEMFNDAVLTYYDVPKKEAAIIFDQLTVDGYGVIKYQPKFQAA